MNKTYNVAEAVEAQKEYCKEYAVKYAYALIEELKGGREWNEL